MPEEESRTTGKVDGDNDNDDSPLPSRYCSPPITVNVDGINAEACIPATNTRQSCLIRRAYDTGEDRSVVFDPLFVRAPDVERWVQ